MIRKLALLLIGLALASPATAQVVPDLELGNPRLQTVQWSEGMDVLVTILPGSGATVMLDPQETILRVTISNDVDFDVRVSPEGNSLLVLAEDGADAARMNVETDLRTYPFTLRAGNGLTAAYLVRFTYGAEPAPSIAQVPEEPLGNWSYRMRGDAEVRPQAIRDDGNRTYISYAPDQALPAVFAIGQTGEEELVNGHMRGGLFVIDRVYSELVFRLDDERARAFRNSQPDGEG